MKEIPKSFFKALPKTELHAHLSGSISSETLHELWKQKQQEGQCLELQDPLLALRQEDGKHHNIVTFFPLFDRYIYNLVNDVDSISRATLQVIEDFKTDGVAYLELRTTPRESLDTAMDKDRYVQTVCEAIRLFDDQQMADTDQFHQRIVVRLILSIDRRMTLEQAMEVVELADKYRFILPHTQSSSPTHGNMTESGFVVGIDLCGNPTRGKVSSLTPAFKRARSKGLKITVHFAEVPQSSKDEELSTILSWKPDRLGHVIHVPEDIKAIIRQRKIGLELCLSCNVLAEMTSGGFAGHHLKEWMASDCPIALSTDDVGVFGSSLSIEYQLAAEAFDLNREGVVKLASSAASASFDKSHYVLSLLREFDWSDI